MPVSILGGTEAYLLEWTMSKWTNVGPTPNQHDDHSCIKVGEEIFVIGPGAIDVFHIPTGNWYPGPAMPEGARLMKSAIVPFDETLLLVGGEKNGTETGEVFMFNRANQGWVKREERLERKRMDHVALVVDGGLIGC